MNSITIVLWTDATNFFEFDVIDKLSARKKFSLLRKLKNTESIDKIAHLNIFQFSRMRITFRMAIRKFSSSSTVQMLIVIKFILYSLLFPIRPKSHLFMLCSIAKKLFWIFRLKQGENERKSFEKNVAQRKEVVNRTSPVYFVAELDFQESKKKCKTQQKWMTFYPEHELYACFQVRKNESWRFSLDSEYILFLLNIDTFYEFLKLSICG